MMVKESPRLRGRHSWLNCFVRPATLAAIFAGRGLLCLTGRLAALTAVAGGRDGFDLGPVVSLIVFVHKNRLAVAAGGVVSSQATFYLLSVYYCYCFCVHNFHSKKFRPIALLISRLAMCFLAL